jgi:glycosyltransferase involved in cell wall biosynthesis
MLCGKKICVVLPAYNAEKTLLQTVSEIPKEYIDDIILVDDASTDKTSKKGKELGIYTVTHEQNLGYGGNQKTCYSHALQRGADVVIMLHPDYQYTPKLLVAMGSLIANGQYDVVLGSRILSEGALRGGMPVYKYLANRFLTLFENIMLRKKLSEYHTGYRAFSREVLETLPLDQNSDDFIFDNQMLAQTVYAGFNIGEVSCPTKYFDDASSINFKRSVIYGLGVLKVSVLFRLTRLGLLKDTIYNGIRWNQKGQGDTP